MTRKVIVAVVVLCAVGFVAAYAEETAKDKSADQVLEGLKKQIAANEAAKEKVRQFVAEKCLPVCVDPVLIEQTEAQNAKKVSLDEIKKIDKQWMAAEEQLPIQKEKLSNACAKAIREIVKKNPAILEAFAMDDQGAVVGENNLTSDYWQGDEPKWQKSYNEGKGGVEVGKESLDKSVNTVVQQVSLPLVNKQGKIVGAITFGIDVSKV